MTRTSRRAFIGSAGTLGAAAAGGGAGGAGLLDGRSDAPWLQTVLERYAAFGVKASGGAGDEACGAWLEGELSAYGFRTERQAFEAPYFEERRAQLALGPVAAPVIPQALVASTGPDGLAAPLRLARDGAQLEGAIALVELPYKRWGALADPSVARPLAEALARGARGVVLVTTGPTKEAIALNVSPHGPAHSRPVAVLAPKDASPFLTGAREGAPGVLVIDGQGGRRPAFNLIARLERGAPFDLIVSTPRSGWFTCAAERGSGLAVWLWLARWLARADLPVNVELVATSGHEYEYLGGEHYLSRAPGPERTRLWTHIGASAAARDWHELGRLEPLPSADPQRVLTATADIAPCVRAAFHGITGLEATYVASPATAGGELVNVLAGGYRTMIGLYGGHRYFHTRSDDLRCASGALTAPVARAFQTALLAVLA